MRDTIETSVTLRDGWFISEFAAHVDLAGSGIYEWRIEGIGLYTGKARKLSSRIHAYPRNLRNLIAGKPWHGNPTRSYRPIHLALRDAYEQGRRVTVTVLEMCNSQPETRLSLERQWIAKRREEERLGGPKVLNAS